MRTFKDRLRHTALFELIALFLVAFVGGWAVGQSPQVMGALSLMFSVLAMAWNMLFNWLFDLWDQRYRGGAARTVGLRIVHAVLFELALVFSGMFLVAWWLDMSLLDALILDVGFSAFFLVYAFAYNWAYDMVFPVGQSAQA